MCIFQNIHQNFLANLKIYFITFVIRSNLQGFALSDFKSQEQNTFVHFIPRNIYFAKGTLVTFLLLQKYLRCFLIMRFLVMFPTYILYLGQIRLLYCIVYFLILWCCIEQSPYFLKNLKIVLLIIFSFIRLLLNFLSFRLWNEIEQTYF